jgi:hypothetical protein
MWCCSQARGWQRTLICVAHPGREAVAVAVAGQFQKRAPMVMAEVSTGEGKKEWRRGSYSGEGQGEEGLEGGMH